MRSGGSSYDAPRHPERDERPYQGERQSIEILNFLILYRQVIAKPKGSSRPCRFSSIIRHIYNDLPMTFGFQATLITATAKT